MKANYHTHTYRCNHAIGSEEDYVKTAIQAGIKELGMSDHCPWPIRKLENMRMEMHELPEYLQTLKKLREKYRDQISIKIGLECEYFEADINILEMYKNHPDIDYLLFGNHFHLSERRNWYYGNCVRDERTLRLYVEDSIAGIKSGLYQIFAHPDLCFREYGEFDEAARKASYEICVAAKEHNVYLEYNLSGIRMYQHQIPLYPRYEFWQIAAEVGNRVMIGVDAHKPSDLLDKKSYIEGVATLRGLGVSNIVDFLEESE